MAYARTTSGSAGDRIPATDLPPLNNGDHLVAAEFLRRYESMPEIKKAELVNGIVFMGSPVRTDRHGEPDNLLQMWLGNFAIASPGIKAATNSTVRLGPDDVLQPDALLRILPDWGGQAKIDSKGYLIGAPELVAEIASSSASLDVCEKRSSYRRAGVREYLIWRTDDAAVDWWILSEDEYHPMNPDPAGIVRSLVFPGLWLDVPALLAGEAKRVLATLHQGMSHPDHTTFIASLNPSQ